MPTVAELTEQARKLELKGFSKLKKPELEKLIDDELRRRERLELKKIRDAEVNADLLPGVGGFIPAQPLDVETIGFDSEDVRDPRGLGISNRIRIGHYLCQDNGRKKLTPAMARRMRKHFNRGDITVSIAALFPNVNVLPFL